MNLYAIFLTNEPARHGPVRAVFFVTSRIELNTKNSTRLSCPLVEFLVCNSAFGSYRHYLQPKQSTIIVQLVQSGGVLLYYSIVNYLKVVHFLLSQTNMMMMDYYSVSYSQFLCLPKAELNPKNSTRGQLSLVEILVFNSILDVMKKHGVDRSVPFWFICRRKLYQE